MAYIVKTERVEDKDAGVYHITEIWREDYPTTRQWAVRYDEPIPPTPTRPPSDMDAIMRMMQRIAIGLNIDISDIPIRENIDERK